MRAQKKADAGEVDTKGRFSVFSQAMRQLNGLHPSALRRVGKIYNALFLGEFGHDAGGLYRESYSVYSSELQVRAGASLAPLERIPLVGCMCMCMCMWMRVCGDPCLAFRRSRATVGRVVRAVVQRRVHVGWGVCASAQSNFLPLLVKSPNNRNTYGANREAWMPNPAATSSVNMEMFTFIGARVCFGGWPAPPPLPPSHPPSSPSPTLSIPHPGSRMLLSPPRPPARVALLDGVRCG
jgi:hypothetical protein